MLDDCKLGWIIYLTTVTIYNMHNPIDFFVWQTICFMQLTNVSVLHLLDAETCKLICSLLRYDAMTGRVLVNFPELFATTEVRCSCYMFPGNHLAH